MSFPPSLRTRSGPSGPRRRSLLAVTPAALLTAGCSAGSGTSGAGGDAGAGSGASAAERVRARAARDSRELALRYDAVIAAHPKLAGRLRPLREAVVRHAEAFGADPGAGGEGSRGASSGVPSSGVPSSGVPSSGVPSSGVPSSGVPASEKDALALLVAAERELAGRRADALSDVPGELARLLASVAAAGAAHVYLLTEG